MGAYYLSEKKRRHLRWRVLRPFLILLCIALMLVLFFNCSLLPQVTALCERAIENDLSALAAVEAYRVLSEEGYGYESFIRLSYDDAGALRSASVDTVALSLLKTKLSLCVLEKLSKDTLTVGVPVSSLFGILLLSEASTELPVTVLVSPSVRAQAHSLFQTAGINQTRHAISLSLCFSVTYLLPTGKEEASFTFSLPIAETVIVGEVPDNFTSISRLTDAVSEYDIDDVVDFGGVVS